MKDCKKLQGKGTFGTSAHGVDDLLRRAGKGVLGGVVTLTLATSVASMPSLIPSACAEDMATEDSESRPVLQDVLVRGEDGVLQVLKKDSTYSNKTVVVSLMGKTAVDETASRVRLFDADGNAVLECVPNESADELRATTCVSFDLAGGRYAKAQFVVTDRSGKSADLWVGPFAIDADKPVVRVGYSTDEVCATYEATHYFDCPQSMPISLCDQNLDTDHTLINGISLSDLITRTAAGSVVMGNVTYGAWEHEVDEAGLHHYRSTITFADGAYELPLVRAQDVAGHIATEAHDEESAKVTSFVVDSHAPLVKATTALAPAFEGNTGDDKTALFFAGSVGLTFSFEDVSDIASVELDEESKRLGAALELAPDMSEAKLTIPRGVLSDALSLTVSDRAGNARTWSMSPYGRVLEAGYDLQAENTPMLDPTGQPLCADGHPTLLVEDREAPRVELGGVAEGACLRSKTLVHVDVTDDRLGYLACNDPGRIIAVLEKDGKPVAHITAGYENADSEDTFHRYELEVSVRPHHEDDGGYVLKTLAADVSGRKAKELTRSFVIDTTSPVLTVQFMDEGPTQKKDGTSYVSGQRTARITVFEKNYTLAELNGTDSPMTISVTATRGGSVSDAHMGAWSEGSKPGEFVCDVTFVTDGWYGLRVSGRDEAGNLLVGEGGTEVNAKGEYASDEFVIDTTAPKVTFDLLYDPSNMREHEGQLLFRKPVTAKVTVFDRNLDVSATSVTDSQGHAIVPAWEASEPEADGAIAYSAYVTYCEEDVDPAWGNEVLHVRATDLAMNAYASDPYRFVVDQTAPSIESASVNKRPYAQVAQAESDPFFFYNEQDGLRTTLRFVVSDEHLLDALWVDDPDGAYDVRVENVHGLQACEFELQLKDQVAHDAQHETDFERDVRIIAQDMAGNTRTWTIDRRGNLVADRATDATNESLDGLGVYPLALIHDVTAPSVRIEGVEPGRYYKAAQDVTVFVDERNFAYIQGFDPSRSIVTFEKREGTTDGGQDRWKVSAKQFEGSGTRYSSQQRLAADGHYRVEAQFSDMAGNVSQRAKIDEFTIDTTAPIAYVTWDNTDVRNGKYYRAPRTATVTVVEHNFDPALIDISTTGEVEAWTTCGDEHTCCVRFKTDAPAASPHTLAIRGKDLAENELDELREPDFVIDTQAPTIAFKRRISEEDLYEATSEEGVLMDKSAFCEALVPIVSYEDDANFDAHGVEVTLEGKRHAGDVINLANRHQEQVGANAGRTYWDNLGLDAQGEQPSYRIGADDVYTINAEVVDMAGNSSGNTTVTFSLNRYGSNYFFEGLEERYGVPEVGEDGTDVLLSKPPRIVVHEVNVSGMAMVDDRDGLREDCTVTKEHAHASSQIERTDSPEHAGYTLEHVDRASVRNPYEGWSEYEYVVAPGNFGKGSDSDYGDGGQGAYRVNVSSRDQANNDNSTAQFWGSGVLREGSQPWESDVTESPAAKDATVHFSLDEVGPAIEDVDVPGSLCVGSTYRASFHLTDEITTGDVVRVLVDGKPARVFREGDTSPIKEGESVRQGTFYFDIDAMPAVFSRDVEISVEDYTGLTSRAQTVHIRNFRLTTLLWELGALVAVLAVTLGTAILWRTLRERRGYTR